MVLELQLRRCGWLDIFSKYLNLLYFPPSEPCGRHKVKWTKKETEALLNGVKQLGAGNWAVNYSELSARSNIALKD